MKIFVYTVFVLLCMQSVRASSSSNECESKIGNIREEIREFLDQFEKFKKQFDNNMNALKEICTDNGRGLENLKSKDCSKEADSEAKKFVRSFSDTYSKSYHFLLGSFLICYQLRELADEFRCNNLKYLTCNSADKSACTCSCEAEMNDLVCALFAFFDSLGSAGLDVHNLFLLLINACGKMHELVWNLGCARGTGSRKDECSCSSNGMNSRDLEIQAFIQDINQPYTDAKNGLSAIIDKCANMSSAIESLRIKVK